MGGWNLVGDFNVDVCLDLFDLVSIPLALLTQLVNVPTRLSSLSASAIDHAYSVRDLQSHLGGTRFTMP